MRIIQTFWTADKNPLTDNYGWLSPEFHLMSWTLSCLRLKEHYNDVVLYTDSKGKEVLCDILKLPYSNIHNCYDHIPFGNPNLWAYPKILSYAKQSVPFLHVDGDVYIGTEFPERFLDADLIAQNKELATSYYKNIISELDNSLSYKPEALKRSIHEDSIKSYNAGILGGKNFLFFKNFLSEATKFIAINLESDSKVCPSSNFNILFEQLLFAELAALEKIDVNCYFTDVIEDYGYSTDLFCDFSTKENGSDYVHYIGNKKQDRLLCRQMASVLASDYPDYYLRILSLFSKKNLRFQDFQDDLGTDCKYNPEPNVSVLQLPNLFDDANANHYEQPVSDGFQLTDEEAITRQYEVTKEYLKSLYLQLEIAHLILMEKRFTGYFGLISRLPAHGSSLRASKNPYLYVLKSSFDWPTEIKYKINPKMSIDNTWECRGIAFIPSLFDDGYEELVLNEIQYNTITFLSEVDTLDQIFVLFKTLFEDEIRELPEIYRLYIITIKFLQQSRCIFIESVE